MLFLSIELMNVFPSKYFLSLIIVFVEVNLGGAYNFPTMYNDFSFQRMMRCLFLIIKNGFHLFVVLAISVLNVSLDVV